MKKLNVGDKMPNLTMSNVNGEKKAMEDLIGGKPTFFMVLRYIGCTVCRYDVHLLQERYNKFTEKGAQVYVVMQSDPEVVKADLAGVTLPFDILCDPELIFYNELQIEAAKDIPELVGDMAKFEEKVELATKAGFEHGKYEGIEEQFPALFFVNKDGVVKVAHYAKDIMDMPSIDEMIAMI